MKRLVFKMMEYFKIYKFKHKYPGIDKTVRLKHVDAIKIGDNCRIGENSYLYCWKEYVYGNIRQALQSQLLIGNNFSATRDLTIQCCNRIMIGNDVLIASNVFICDYNHGIDKISGTYLDNYLALKEVVIGDGVWIGQGCYILPGVHIGNNSIVGAGSVVTKDVPAFCMVVGNPARIIKKYNIERDKWEELDNFRK